MTEQQRGTDRRGTAQEAVLVAGAEVRDLAAAGPRRGDNCRGRDCSARRPLHDHATINDTGDFEIRKGLTHLPALREIGFSANRRLLGVQRLSHNSILAAEAFTAVHQPIITDDGHRITGLPLGDRRAHALLQALLLFRLLPNGFRNRGVRELLAGLLGKNADEISAGHADFVGPS